MEIINEWSSQLIIVPQNMQFSGKASISLQDAEDAKTWFKVKIIFKHDEDGSEQTITLEPEFRILDLPSALFKGQAIDVSLLADATKFADPREAIKLMTQTVIARNGSLWVTSEKIEERRHLHFNLRPLGSNEPLHASCPLEELSRFFSYIET